MTSNHIIRSVIITAVMLLLTNTVLAGSQGEDDESHLKILILGGTGFIGPWEVAAAKAHGHEITLFNRGKSAPHLFPELEKLKGDRDPEKDDGLIALQGRKFDVVIDNSGYYPRHVKASAELLAPNVGHYIYISSISAYADPSVQGLDEASPVATMEDPTVEEMGAAWENYGPLKALCESAAEAAMPGRTTVIRPGFIVGPGDPTHRFTYWPLRVRQGGEMAVPGSPSDPIQVIDARDLANWIIHLAENKITGVFNGCGPAEVLTMGEVVETAKKVTSSDAAFTWLSTEFQERHPEAQFPIWVGLEGPYAGFSSVSNERAIRAGLKFRPVSETIADLLEQFDTLAEEKRLEAMSLIPIAGEAVLIEEARGVGNK